MSSTTSNTLNRKSSLGTKERSGKHRMGGNRGRGGRPSGKTSAAAPLSDLETKGKEPKKSSEEDIEASEDTDVCWICAEPVKYYSVSECNHRTCHVCALRLRALYKKLDCTFCKVGYLLLSTS